MDIELNDIMTNKMVIITKSQSSIIKIPEKNISIEEPSMTQEKAVETSYYFEMSTDVNINLLHKKVLMYVKEDKKEEYISKALPYLQEYNKLSTVKNVENIKSYVDMAKNYFDFSYSEIKSDIQRCIDCGKRLKSEMCTKCLTINDWTESFKEEPQKDKKKEKVKNFIKVLLDFEGSRPLPSKLIHQIDEIMKEKKIVFKTVDDMVKELSGKGIKDLEREKHNIFYYLTGKTFIEIDDVKRENIIKRFELFDDVQDEIKGRYGRENSLNNQFTLWCILNSEGFNISSSLFDILKTPSSLEIHNEMGKHIYVILSIRDNKFEWKFKVFIN